MAHAEVSVRNGCFPLSLWMLAVCLFFGPVTAVLALDPTKSLTQYNCQTWSRQNGLMANGVNAIAQTEDGYLWLGTSSGLIRFDGMNFTTLLPPQSGNNIVTTLASARSSGLWVGLENNDVRYYDGMDWPTNQRVPTVKVDWSNRSLKVDKDGTLLIVSAKHLGWLTSAGQYQTVLSIPDDQVTNIICGFRDSQGRYWFGTAENGVGYWRDGVVHPLVAPETDGRMIYSLAEDHEGNLWVGSEGDLFCYDASLHRKNIPPVKAGIKALLVDRQGVLWIGTGSQGLLRYYHGTYDFINKVGGLANDFVNSLAEDREGNIWVGTRDGVSVLTDVKFPTCAASGSAWVHDSMYVCPARRGGIWIGQPIGLSHRDVGVEDVGVEAGLTNLAIRRVFEARNGDLYLICGSRDLIVFSKGKIVAKYTTPQMFYGPAEDGRGVVVTAGGDLFRVGTNYFTPYVFKDNLPPPMYFVNNMALGRDGVIWVATVNGIVRVKDGTFQQWTTAEGLCSDRVESLCEDSEGVVWAAMPSGIARLKNNEIRCISAANGLFDNEVFAIVPDDLGYLWMDAGRGIFRVSRQSLNDFADGRTKRVECTAYDGLESVKPADKTFQEKVGCKSLDGRIWFPSPNGVVMINPRLISTNNVPPPVLIQKIRANGREYARNQPILVPPGSGDVELNFAALSFVAPQQVRFRYQLIGYDSDWVDAGSRRLAFYTNLKPGRYQFRVIAANADGIWNRVGDTVGIELRPHFYQTGWFYAGCAGLLAAGVVGFHRRQVRRVELKQRALRESRDRLEREVQQRTAELAHERDLFRSLLDNSPDHIFFKNVQSCFIKSSTAQAGSMARARRTNWRARVISIF
jgi:ligand-binding sensor domain-containing protein